MLNAVNIKWKFCGALDAHSSEPPLSLAKHFGTLLITNSDYLLIGEYTENSKLTPDKLTSNWHQKEPVSNVCWSFVNTWRKVLSHHGPRGKQQATDIR